MAVVTRLLAASERPANQPAIQDEQMMEAGRNEQAKTDCSCTCKLSYNISFWT